MRHTTSYFSASLNMNTEFMSLFGDILVVSLNLVSKTIWKMVASKAVLYVFIIALEFTLCNAANYPMCTSENDGWTFAGELGASADPITTCRDNCRNVAETTFCAVRRNGKYANKVFCYCGEDPPETTETTCTFLCENSPCGGPGDLRSVYPVCPLGTYGPDCGTSCGHCLGDYCRATSGECPSGCVDGYYLAGCTEACSANCMQTTCERSTGSCHGGCENGWYTPQCTTACPINCDTSCHINSGDCDKGCEPGWYSKKCTQRCPANCTNTLCDQTTGGCISCNPGWYTGNCDVPCSENCAQTSCSMDNGACEWGCKGGWFKPNCTSPCPTNCDPYVCDINGGSCDGGCTADYFGSDCDQHCHKNCYMKCDKTTGNCTNGCDDGYYGAVCDQICPKCGDPRCKNDSGHCYSCPPGFYNDTCTTTCPSNCQGDVCDMADGVCTHGCKVGWNGTQCHEDFNECSEPTLNNCSDHGPGFECHNFDGYFYCCQYGLDPTKNDTICLISKDDGLSTPAITGICVSVVVLVAAVLIVVMLLWRKGKMKPSRKENDGETNFAFQGTRPKEVIADPPSVKDVDYSNTSGTSEHAIGLSNFVSYVQAIVRGEHNIAVEYEDLPSGELHDWDQSRRPEVKQKNKFKGIYPYNYNRVVLGQINDDPATDYINASRIQGYRPDDKFIASLGPRLHTIADFWRMVWQENVVTIVMLTNLVEAGIEKCEQYWPSENSELYGDLQVTAESDDKWPTYHIRRLTLIKGNSKRRVTQYHFTQWPDHGVPSEATALLNFRRKALGGNPRTAPVLVHCSAGVGRTGTLIALDYLIKQGEAESKMDVYNCVYNLRHQRIRMVQTVDQYTFLHEALADCVKVGVTALSSSNFRENYTRIIDKHRGGVLSEQFEALRDLSPKVSFDDKEYACSSTNMDKNRNPDIIPIMSSRVFLNSRMKGRNDYINAVRVNGHKTKDAFHVTQIPLENTVVDFWRMIHDYGSSVVVVLTTKLQAKSVAQFLPAKNRPMDVLERVASVRSSMTSESYRVIDINLADTSDDGTEYMNMEEIAANSERAIRVYEITLSPDQRCLDYVVVLDVYNRIRARKDGKPVTVMCLNGATYSGQFVACCNLFEMIESEQEIDVFQVSKYIRDSRPEFIGSLDQYRGLYDAAHLFLTQSDTYEN